MKSTHREKHMQPEEALPPDLPAMAGKSGAPPGGSRSSTMTLVSSLRPPCARCMADISLFGASCRRARQTVRGHVPNTQP